MSIKSLSAFSSRMFSYRFFKAFPQWKRFDTGKMKDLTHIVKEFHSDLIEAVATERRGVDLPKNMGKLMVISYRSDRQYPSFKGPSDAMPVIHTNDHTDGLKCKILYTNYEKKYRVKDRFIWSFAPEVNFKRIVSREFSKDYSRFTFSPDRMQGEIKKAEVLARDVEKVKIQKFLKTHNEFAI